jgi:ferrous iron transport protein B
MYILGIIIIIISGLLLKHVPFSKGEPSGFLMELPPYRLPRVKNIFLCVYERSKSFLIKAGTVIFLASGIVWFLQHYNLNLVMVDTNHSILALIGKLISPVFIPLGFGNSEAAMSILMGFLAKENIVATFGILFNAKSDIDLINSVGSLFTPLSAYSFMVFTLLASPCVAAIGTIKKEMHSLKWTLFALAYQTGTAYIVSLFIYQIGNLLSLILN